MAPLWKKRIHYSPHKDPKEIDYLGLVLLLLLLVLLTMSAWYGSKFARAVVSFLFFFLF